MQVATSCGGGGREKGGKEKRGMKGKGREDVEGKGDEESGEELGGKGGRTDRSDQMKKKKNEGFGNVDGGKGNNSSQKALEDRNHNSERDA